MRKSSLILFSFFLLNIGNVVESHFNQFQAMPKVELHLHLGGSYPLDYLLTIATETQKAALVKNLDLISNGVDYHDGFRVFPLISQIVNTDEKVEKGTEALCRFLEEDGIVYAEIRTGLKNLGSGLEGYLQSVLKGIQTGTSDRFRARLLLSLQRSSSLSQAQATVDLALKYQDQGVVGIDLSGDSTFGQVETILPELKRAKEAGLFLTVHLGESAEEQGQLQILQELQPHRIGHGVFLTAEALKWILKNDIPIEVCPTSSVLVKMIERYEQHPALQYQAQGHPIVICTDDPLIFQNSLSSELTVLSEKTLLSYEQLQAIAKNAVQHAFLSQEEKQFLIAKYYPEWK